MKTELVEINENDNVEDHTQINVESLRKGFLAQRSLVFLDSVEWKVDLRAQKDLKRCSDSKSVIFIQDFDAQIISLRSIIDSIKDQLVANEILPTDELQNFTHHFISDNHGKN